MTLAIDTNVLVRYLTWDDDTQAQIAAELLESGEPMWISTVVLCETVWVLKRISRYSAKEITEALKGLVAPHHISVEDTEALNAGLDALSKGVDFADGCILNLALHTKAQPLVTFDRRLAKVGGASVQLLNSN